MITSDPLRSGHAHACGAQGDGDRSVSVRATQVDTPQRVEHRPGRMPVVVPGADADHHDVGAHSVEKPRRVRVPAMMRHLEHRSAQTVWPGEHAGLGGDLDVASEQHRAFGSKEAEDERALVRLVAQQTVRRRADHLNPRRAQREALPGRHGLHRDPPRGGRLIRGDDGRVDIVKEVERHRPDEKHADLDRGEDCGQTAAVIRMRMGEGHSVEPPDAPRAQLAQYEMRIGTPVDQHLRARRGLDEQRVALAHVEGSERQAGLTAVLPHGRQDGQHDCDHDPDNSEPGGAPPDHERHSEDQPHEQEALRMSEQVDGREAGAVGEPLAGPEGQAERRTREPCDGAADGNRQLRPEGGDPANGRRDRGSRHSDKVRGDRGEGQGALDTQQEGSDAELRAEAGGSEQTQRTRARQTLRERRSEDEHPCGGEHRQPEADLPGDRGVGEQQKQHCGRERVRRVWSSPERPGEQHERRHDARTQDRGLRTDEQREPAQRA